MCTAEVVIREIYPYNPKRRIVIMIQANAAANPLVLQIQEGGGMAKQISENDLTNLAQTARTMRGRAEAYHWSEGKDRTIYCQRLGGAFDGVGVVLLVDETNKSARQWRLTLSATNPIAQEHEIAIMREFGVPAHAVMRLPVQGFDREQGKNVVRFRWAYGVSAKVELPFGVGVSKAVREERCSGGCNYPIAKGDTMATPKHGGKFHLHCYKPEAAVAA